MIRAPFDVAGLERTARFLTGSSRGIANLDVAGLERTARFLHGPRFPMPCPAWPGALRKTEPWFDSPRAPAVRAFGRGDSPDASGSGACFCANMKRVPGGKVHSPIRNHGTEHPGGRRHHPFGPTGPSSGAIGRMPAFRPGGIEPGRLQ